MTAFNPLAARILVGITGTVVGAIICFGTAVAPATAHAISDVRDGAVPTVSVSYADLDLASAADRAKLDRRISFAAYEVCGGEDAARSIETSAAQRECIRHAIASATHPVRDQVAAVTSRR